MARECPRTRSWPPTSTPSTSAAARTASRPPPPRTSASPCRHHGRGGAVLAAVIQSPSSLDPTTDPEALQARWNYVLDGMVTMSALASTERQSMVSPTRCPPRPTPTPCRARTGGPDPGPGPARAGRIRGERTGSQHRGSADHDDDRSHRPAGGTRGRGRHVRRRAGEPAYRGRLDRPKSGAVRAYYGGDDGKGFDFAQAGLQTGSSFKVRPGRRAPAGHSAVPDLRQLPAVGLRRDDQQRRGESCGKCTIAEALKRSLNTSFYRLTLSMDDGAQKIADAAHQAASRNRSGVAVPHAHAGGWSPENGIVLGQYLTPIDMASAYATLAASGMSTSPTSCRRS